ncbi:Uncharacterised protein [Streptococcus salivarius]|nr:Uncharacterised protein [Streptococcus salivarius]VUW85166.1 Uncharacterised protein [Streptococcus thermophilus]
MKKSSKRFTTLTALVLTSVLFLGACGDNKKESASISSSSKVSQKVKSSTSSSSKEKTKKSEQKKKSSSSEEVAKATSGEKDSQTPAENVAGTAQQEVAPTNPTEGTAVGNQGATTEQPATPAVPAEQASTTTAVDTTAIANGDFSSVAGTYQNDLGDTIMVSPSGSVTRVTAVDGYSDTSSQLHNGFAQDGSYVAGFAHNDGPTSDPIFFDSNGQVRFGSDAIYGRMHVYNKLD